VSETERKISIDDELWTDVGIWALKLGKKKKQIVQLALEQLITKLEQYYETD
jgi:hypothetical protein